MNKTELYIKINEDFSISQLAKHFNKSKTTIRYWLKKYDFKTSYKRTRNKKIKCIICTNTLSATRVKYCSNKCKQKAHYLKTKNNPNTYQSQSKRATQRKLLFVNKLGKGCSKCGYNKNLSALEFHHVDETKKDMSLDSRNLGNHSLKILEKELSKCILLCANCHREHHYPQNMLTCRDSNSEYLVMSET